MVKMEQTDTFDYKSYMTVLCLCVITLIILAFRIESKNINNECLNYKGATSGTKNSKTVKKCLDGKNYDSKKAPIYHGDIFGDDKKQAKKLRKYIKPYLKKKGYEQYTDILVGICAQESRFGILSNKNWMQVNGYSGQDGIASTKAGIDHFIQLIQHAKKLKCKDITTIIQAYNFGNYYIDYCMERGGKDTPSIRSDFQEYQKKKIKRDVYGDIEYAEKILQRIQY